MDSFEHSYSKTYNMLNCARDFHNRRNARKQLNLYDMAPGQFQKTFFASKLHPDVASFVKIVYDASQPGANIVAGLLYSLQQRTQICKVTSCDITSSKVFICNIKQTKSMVLPELPHDFVALFNLCGALFDTELMHHSFINSHKSMRSKIHFTHSSRVLERLREEFHAGHEACVGQFAAVLMWFLHTKQMNKIQNVDKLCTGALITVNLNSSTRLHKCDPCPVVIPQLRSEEEHNDDENDELEENDAKAEDDVQNLPLQNDDDDIPDDWEDIEF